MMNSQTNGWGKKPTNSTATTELKEAVKASEMRRLTFNIPEDLHRMFKVYAANNNTNMGDILNSFIKTIVNK